MPQINKGDTFANGEQVTGARLNQLVDQATILPAIITDQANIDAGTLASDDAILIVDTSESGLREAKALDLVGSNLPVVTSSITGQATQVSVTNGTNPTTYYSTSDITIVPNSSALVTTKNYNSPDGSSVVVTSASHGLEAGQVVQTSSATSSIFNGTFRLIAANADTFTYLIPLSFVPSSGFFSTTNGIFVTVTTSAPHGLTTGNTVAFVTSNSALNTTAIITVINSTSFNYSLSTAFANGSGSFTAADNKYTVVTTSSNHNLVDGTSLAITASNSNFSGTYPATVLSPTTFSYSLETAFGSASASASYNNTVSPYVVTVLKTAHGLVTGNTVVVTCTSGNSNQNSYLSGTYTITVTGVDTFTYPKPGYVVYSSTTATLAISYVLSNMNTSGTVTYVLSSAYTGNVSYTVSPTTSSGTLSYLKKGAVKNKGNKVINGNLYVDGTTTLNSDTRLTGNVTITTTPTNGTHATNKNYVDGTVSKTSNGSCIFPNGLIMQWGITPAISFGVGATTTFPTAFPTACLNVTTTLQHGTANTTSGEAGSVWVKTLTATNFIIQTNITASSTASTGLVYWQAIGY